MFKPKIRVNFDSDEGNIFFIRAKAVNAIKAFYVFDSTEKLKDFNDKFEAIKNKGYEDALDVIWEFVEIIEE